MGHLCKDRAREVADNVLHLCTDYPHWMPLVCRGGPEEQSHRLGVYHVMLHQPSPILAIRYGFAELGGPERYVSLPPSEIDHSIC